MITSQSDHGKPCDDEGEDPSCHRVFIPFILPYLKTTVTVWVMAVAPGQVYSPEIKRTSQISSSRDTRQKKQAMKKAEKVRRLPEARRTVCAYDSVKLFIFINTVKR
ncbi:hypothetical protein RRG08_016002 [Elysia crispata]|uniref:Uncharacterized protein n=1 Tax=Elysia crispata TaxID=231223 RepID=A0AAE1CPL6_9GAST|nr:hypothetical protein RRG08_016002 [Elysia crispata]